MSRSADILTGTFVLAGAAIVVGGALWLANASWAAESRQVTARFGSIGQLKEGSRVTLRGVEVGDVDGVEFASDGVLVTLRVRSEVPLPDQPAVLIRPASLFGEWEAAIIPLSARPDMDLTEIDLASGVLPGITQSDFAELSESTAEIARNLKGITDRFQIAFDEQTAQDFARAIQNFERTSSRMSDILESQRESFGAFADDLTEAGEKLRDAVGDLDATLARLEAATAEGQLEAIFDNAEAASASLNVAAGRLDGTLTSLERALAEADSTLREAHALAASVNRGEGSLGRLVTDEVLYENTAATLAELRALLDDLKRNPRKYFNFSVF